jgi:hypothetical protein
MARFDACGFILISVLMIAGSVSRRLSASGGISIPSRCSNSLDEARSTKPWIRAIKKPGASRCPRKPGTGPEQNLYFLDLQAQGDAELSPINLIIEHVEHALHAVAKLDMALVGLIAEQQVDVIVAVIASRCSGRRSWSTS